MAIDPEREIVRYFEWVESRAGSCLHRHPDSAGHHVLPAEGGDAEVRVLEWRPLQPGSEPRRDRRALAATIAGACLVGVALLAVLVNEATTRTDSPVGTPTPTVETSTTPSTGTPQAVPVTFGAPLFSVPASSLSPSPQYETMWDDSDRVSFTSDGSTIVAFSGGALARIDAGSGTPGALTMLFPLGASDTTRISRDGSHVYVPPEVIDTVTGVRIELTDIRLDVRGEFNPAGDRIVVPAISRNGQGRAIVFDVETGAALFELTSDDVAITWATWSPDGSLLMTQGEVGVTRVWDALTGEELLTLPDADSESSFSPDGSNVVTVGPSERVRVRDALTGTQLALDEQFPVGSDPQAWFSADGTTVLVVHADPEVAGSAIATAWNVSDGSLVGTIPGLAAGSELASGSSAGDQLVVLAADGSAQIWSITGSRELATVASVSEAFISVGFSPDGRRLVALESDRTVRVWEVS